MNLIFRPAVAVDGTPNTRRSVSTEAVVANVTAAKSALEAELQSKVTALAETCAAAERTELEYAGLGRGHEHSGTIEQLRVQITDLEGRIEHYTQALVVLDPEE